MVSRSSAAIRTPYCHRSSLSRSHFTHSRQYIEQVTARLALMPVLRMVRKKVLRLRETKMRLCCKRCYLCAFGASGCQVRTKPPLAAVVRNCNNCAFGVGFKRQVEKIVHCGEHWRGAIRTTHQASVRKIRRITQVTRNILQNEARGGLRRKTDGPRETTTVITQAFSRKLNVSKAKLIMVSITGKKLARLNSR